MSIADLTSAKYSSDPADHAPIIREKERHATLHGGWSEWTVGCICGFYDAGYPGKWFIPGRVPAEKIYKRHLEEAGVIVVEDTSDDEPEEKRPDYDFNELQQTIAQPFVTIVQSLMGMGMSKREAFTIVKHTIFRLEREVD